MDILNTILTVIYGLLMLTLLVVIHEGGHFFVGKKCGIRINEFSVGFGPKLFSRKKDEIAYSVRALPLGGFVSFYGEDEEIDKVSEPRAFNNMPIWKRALTIMAGPVMNILTALIVTVVILISYGDYVPVIAAVSEDMPAYEAGLLPGDRIVMINDKKIDFSMEFSAYEIDGRDEIVLGVERDGEYREFTVKTVYDENEKRNMIGIQYDTSVRKKFGFFEAIGLSFKWIWLIVKELFDTIGKAIFGGRGITDMSGTVGTIMLVGTAVRYGFENILRLIALLSINLGIMNFLPFPALDGGRLVMLGIEKIIGKPVNRNVEAIINLVGFGLLIILMIFLTIQDIGRFF